MFMVTSIPHKFDSARSAIDALSNFEAAVEADYDYRIQGTIADDGDITYTVGIYATEENSFLGYITQA